MPPPSLAPDACPRHGLAGVIAQAITLWALMGGLALAGIVAVNVLSVAVGLTGRGFAGDFEVTELLAATAIFAFLPYAQLTRAHVAAEIFTARAGRRMQALASSIAGILGALIAAVLIWRMAAGLGDQRAYGAETAIMQLPIWWAYVPALISLALWVAAGVLTAKEAVREARDG
jgi:TRAP-type C4-dicarboxylate transport system permease small subunit